MGTGVGVEMGLCAPRDSRGRGWAAAPRAVIRGVRVLSPRLELELNGQSELGAWREPFLTLPPSPCAGVLVKVVELYFCQSCGQSFPEASLLSRHRCPLLPPPEHLQLPGAPPAPAREGQREPPGSEPPGASTPQGSAADRLPCPVCREAFGQPGELKEHFKTHRGPRGALPCPQKGCCFATEDRKQLRGHLRRLHGASPVSCAYRACPLLFPSRPAMEQHRRSHFPFHCARCDFVTANAKLFWRHRKGHGAEVPAAGSAPLKPRCGLPAGTARFGVEGHPGWRLPPTAAWRSLSFSPEAGGQEDAGNCHPGWEATAEEIRPAKPSGAEEGSLEELKASGGEEDSDSGGDESLEENGESPCEGEEKEGGKEAPEKAKVPRAQYFKGTTVGPCWELLGPFVYERAR